MDTKKIVKDIMNLLGFVDTRTFDELLKMAEHVRDETLKEEQERILKIIKREEFPINNNYLSGLLYPPKKEMFPAGRYWYKPIGSPAKDAVEVLFPAPFFPKSDFEYRLAGNPFEQDEPKTVVEWMRKHGVKPDKQVVLSFWSLKNSPVENGDGLPAEIFSKLKGEFTNCKYHSKLYYSNDEAIADLAQALGLPVK